MARKSIKVNDLLGALGQLDQFTVNHGGVITSKGLNPTNIRANIAAILLILQTREQAQEDAKTTLKDSTQAVDGEVNARYPEFSSLIDLLRGALGNNTTLGKQLTNIRKLVTGGGQATGGSSTSTSGGGSSSSGGGSSSSSTSGSSSSSSS